MEISGQKAFTVWKKSVKKLTKSNIVVPTERNGDTIEINNVCLVINKPLVDLNEIVEFDRKRGNDYSDIERKNYWSAINDRLDSFLLSHSKKISQIDNIVFKLSNNSYNRQAYATVWSPKIDLYTNYPICIVGLYFCIREEKLNMTAILRSNDAWGQALDDIYHLIKIQERVAEQLSIDVGVYTHFAMSYHIYLVDLFKAKKLIEEDFNE